MAPYRGANPSASESPDEWSNWLLHHRHGDDPVRAAQLGKFIDTYVDRVLRGAALARGQRLLDVGTGTGVVAFRAIEQTGRSLQVTLCDVSGAMLEYAARDARDLDIEDQCRFLRASADDLHELAEASFDAVTTRSVLAYVADKSAALAEFYRVLAPGGRISIAEPVMQDDALDTITLRRAASLDTPNAEPGVLALLHRWRAAQFPDTPEKLASNPTTNYSERDLFRWARQAGFAEVDLELRIRSTTAPGTRWETFMRSSPHPWSRTLGEILRDDFSPSERKTLETLFRDGVEARQGESVDRMAYLVGIKPRDE